MAQIVEACFTGLIAPMPVEAILSLEIPNSQFLIRDNPLKAGVRAQGVDLDGDGD
jgi:hypothetical protein